MLEQLYPLNVLEKNPWLGFLIGFSYGIIGIGISILLFPEDPALVAVALIALITYPTISRLMKQEEAIESQKEEFSIFIFFKDHRHVFVLYLLFFIGVLLSFSLFSLFMPSLATNHIFENQINVLYGASSGKATFSVGLFMDLLRNNFVVLTVIFITAFVLGDGGLFLVIWNASVWGTIFGNLAKHAALNINMSPVLTFLLILVIVTPHMMLEAFAYIASATTGGVISKAVVYEKLFSKRFNFIVVNTIISLIFALLVMILAVGVETYVLNNVETYQRIIKASFL